MVGKVVPLSVVLLSVTCDQPWYENIKWKIPEINSSLNNFYRVYYYNCSILSVVMLLISYCA
jgi:hypothetical protein